MRSRHPDTRRRPTAFRIVAAVLAVVGVAMLALPRPADAARLEARGWWSQVTLSLLEPEGASRPDVGPGQLVVEGAASEAVSLAAVRFSLDRRESNPVLTLAVASATGTPSVVACAAASDWRAAEGGAWADRPEADCSTSVLGTPSSDGSAFTFNVAPLAADGRVDVVLLPGKAPNGEEVPLVATFRLVLTSPALTTVAAPPKVPTPVPSGSRPPVAVGEPVAEPTLGDGASVTEGEDVGPVADGAQGFAGGCCADEITIAPLASESSAGPRLLGVLVLLAAVAFALADARWAGETVPLGVGGVGRFVRERDGRPPQRL